ncbi:MAG: Crp/Fnr family transcriptional regulator, partial [Abitibacteriaceae bacterium]|nr:Crp/Fnr family transcriptional regulator [Abditibacteriaceae bacterium]
TLPANRTIITAGRIGEAVYILLKGTVKITVDGLDDKDVILAICGAGEVLGEVSALDGIGHSANVVTLETSKFFWIDCASFRECLQTVPPLAYNLALLQARRLRRISLHAESLAMRDIYGRLAYQILAFANDYGTPVAQQTASKEGARPGDVLIPVRLTQSDLAALVGASRVSVNKVLMSFRRSKFISIDDKYHITLHNRAALAKRCQ